MTQTYRPALVELLEVREDRNGPYAKVKVYCSDNNITIRWGLDAFTFKHFAEAIRRSRVPSGEQSEWTQRIILDAVKRRVNGIIECSVSYTASGHVRSIPFRCSELFQSNHTWLLQVRSFRQLQDLAWDDSHTNLADRATPGGWLPRLRHMGVAMATFSLIGVVGIGAYWYTVHHTQGFAVQLQPVIASSPMPSNQPANLVNPSGSTPAWGTSGVNKVGSQPVGDGSAGAQNVVDTETGPSDESALAGSAASGVPEVYQVAPGEVALTFDDGPSPYTEQILQVLNEYHVHASFFFIGNRVSRWPNAVKDALSSGDLVGNHSESHPDLIKLSQTRQAEQVNDCTLAIEQVDSTPVSLFRPPYGAYNKVTLAVLKQDHITLALWNRDPRDWAAHSPADIVNSVLSDNPSGGVFDLHDTQMTLQALPNIIEGLQKKHLKLVLLPAH